jgi:hypothetical protein
LFSSPGSALVLITHNVCEHPTLHQAQRYYRAHHHGNPTTSHAVQRTQCIKCRPTSSCASRHHLFQVLHHVGTARGVYLDWQAGALYATHQPRQVRFVLTIIQTSSASSSPSRPSMKSPNSTHPQPYSALVRLSGQMRGRLRPRIQSCPSSVIYSYTMCATSHS